MALFRFRKDGGGKAEDGPSIQRTLAPEGARFASLISGGWESRNPAGFGFESGLAAFLLQLEDEGYAEIAGDEVFLPWGRAFEAMESPEHADSFTLLGLPPVEAWRPALASVGTLTDPGFSIHIAGWRTPDGNRPRGDALVEGALIKAEGRTALLTRSAWEAAEAVFSFRRERSAAGGDADSNRRGWATVRAKAVAAAADMTDFLARTVVLTPERLDIGLRKADAQAGNVVEVIPGFEGQPRRWIEMFDRFGEVPDRYEIPDGEGMTHVLVSPEVGTVLREIKRMKGRRVAGDRAEAFLRNPFAALGPDASAVVDPGQFERAREEAGISFSRFTAHVVRDEAGYPFETGLLIEEMAAGEVVAEKFVFEGAAALSKFLGKLDARIAAGSQCCHWEGFCPRVTG